jgi:hypothetical protein
MTTDLIKQQHQEMKELMTRINNTLNQIRINQEETLKSLTKTNKNIIL